MKPPPDPSPFRSPAEKGTTTEEAPKVSSSVRKLYMAEEMLLRAGLENGEAAGELLAQVPPDLYLRSETKELATLILAHLGDEEWTPGVWNVESEAVESLIARLVADPTPLPDPAELEKVGQLLILHWKGAQMKPLTEGRIPTAEEWLQIKEYYEKKQTGSG